MRSPFRKCLFLVFAALFSVLSSGCLHYLVDRNIDVTNNSAWWGELSKNQVLYLTQDALLNGGYLTLSATKVTPKYDSLAIFGRTITVDMFKADPSKYWPELHLLQAGTRVQCIKLERQYSFEFARYNIYVKIMDGECKGQIMRILGVPGDVGKKGTLRMESPLFESVKQP